MKTPDTVAEEFLYCGVKQLLIFTALQKHGVCCKSSMFDVYHLFSEVISDIKAKHAGAVWYDA